MAAMQTFLPYASFVRSARCLDHRRLGKQRVETLQVLRALHFPTYGWRNHVVVRMWRGYVPALVTYGETICDEWRRRGWADSCHAQISEFRARGEARTMEELRRDGALPPWLGSRALHRSHRSALVQRDPAFYRPQFPEVPDDLPYTWPVSDAPEEELGAFSAWVVQPSATVRRPGTAAPRPERVTIDLPEERGHLTRMKRRAVEEDLASAQPGDPVVMPSGADLLIGTIERVESPRRGRVALELRWRGMMPRAGLLRPGLLQNHLPIFALRGEPLPY